MQFRKPGPRPDGKRSISIRTNTKPTQRIYAGDRLTLMRPLLEKVGDRKKIQIYERMILASLMARAHDAAGVQWISFGGLRAMSSGKLFPHQWELAFTNLVQKKKIKKHSSDSYQLPVK